MKILTIMSLLLIVACTGTPTGNVVAEGQEVTVYAKGPEYVFEPATVTAGEAVTLVFDTARLPGCSRAVVIPEYDKQKVISANDNTITFTPQAGDIRIQCSMNMYSGVLRAE